MTTPWTWKRTDTEQILDRQTNSAKLADRCAPMAKLDKAPVYETGDCRFESCSERHFTRLASIGEMAERLKALPC